MRKTNGTRLEFFFDCSSPWTYLAFHNIQPLAREFGVEIEWRPFLVGGVFNSVNQSVYRYRENAVPVRDAWVKKDLLDWARVAGLDIIPRPSVFPVNSAKAMRACLVARHSAAIPRLARALFEAYWKHDQDISQESVLHRMFEIAGFDGAEMLHAIAEPALKQELRDNTQEVADRGGFGTPTIFVNGGDMYFGNDRLPLVRAALKRATGG